jgi:hypothetical protein
MENNNNLDVIETTFEVMDDEPTTSGKGFGKIAIGLTAIAGAGLGIWLYKRRKTADERAKKRLEAKGYIVTAPEVESSDEEVAE